MQAEIFTLCDAATVAGGKLNILGSFDTIGAHSFPCDHPLCAVACKIRFDAGEEGRHSIEIHFWDPEMRPVLKPNGRFLKFGFRVISHRHTFTSGNPSVFISSVPEIIISSSRSMALPRVEFRCMWSRHSEAECLRGRANCGLSWLECCDWEEPPLHFEHVRDCRLRGSRRSSAHSARRAAAA